MKEANAHIRRNIYTNYECAGVVGPRLLDPGCWTKRKGQKTGHLATTLGFKIHALNLGGIIIIDIEVRARIFAVALFARLAN